MCFFIQSFNSCSKRVPFIFLNTDTVYNTTWNIFHEIADYKTDEQGELL